jgi:hypothetical protein
METFRKQSPSRTLEPAKWEEKHKLEDEEQKLRDQARAKRQEENGTEKSEPSE